MTVDTRWILGIMITSGLTLFVSLSNDIRGVTLRVDKAFELIQGRTPSTADTGRAPASASDEQTDFGDDASVWANDGECDDPRFVGVGMGLTDSAEDQGHDATDCSELYEARLIRLR